MDLFCLGSEADYCFNLRSELFFITLIITKKKEKPWMYWAERIQIRSTVWLPSKPCMDRGSAALPVDSGCSKAGAFPARLWWYWSVQHLDLPALLRAATQTSTISAHSATSWAVFECGVIATKDPWNLCFVSSLVKHKHANSWLSRVG